MIKSIQIQNFKNIRDQQVDFERLTVVVGANASGKTTLLEAVDLAVRCTTDDPSNVFSNHRHCDWLYTRGGKGDLRLTCKTEGGTWNVTATPPADFPPMERESIGKGIWKFSVEPHAGADRDRVIGSARGATLLQLNARQLAKASYSDVEPPRIEFDGEGLATVLAYLLLTDRDRFDQLEDLMCEFIPDLFRIRIRKETVKRAEHELIRFGDDAVERRSVRPFQGEALVFDFKNATDVSAHTASEGTLLLLGLLTVLMGPSRPRVLLMDDIEHGLHPRAQRTLLEVLNRIMASHPDLQIVATAHSPLLLDALDPSQVRLVTSGDEGHSVFGRLSDHPDFAKWKDEMSSGELWSLFGEQWLATGERK